MGVNIDKYTTCVTHKSLLEFKGEGYKGFLFALYTTENLVLKIINVNL